MKGMPAHVCARAITRCAFGLMRDDADRERYDALALEVLEEVIADMEALDAEAIAPQPPVHNLLIVVQANAA